VEGEGLRAELGALLSRGVVMWHFLIFGWVAALSVVLAAILGSQR
jgi:hypothetical protein